MIDRPERAARPSRAHTSPALAVAAGILCVLVLAPSMGTAASPRRITQAQPADDPEAAERVRLRRSGSASLGGIVRRALADGFEGNRSEVLRDLNRMTSMSPERDWLRLRLIPLAMERGGQAARRQLDGFIEFVDALIEQAEATGKIPEDLWDDDLTIENLQQERVFADTLRLAFDGDVEAVADRLLPMLDESDEPVRRPIAGRTMVDVHILAAWALGRSDRDDEAIAVAERALTAHLQPNERGAVLRAFSCRDAFIVLAALLEKRDEWAKLARWAGRLDDAVSLRDRGGPEAKMTAAAERARALLRIGTRSDVDLALHRVFELRSVIDADRGTPFACVAMIALAQELGHEAEARRYETIVAERLDTNNVIGTRWWVRQSYMEALVRRRLVDDPPATGTPMPTSVGVPFGKMGFPYRSDRYDTVFMNSVPYERRTRPDPSTG